MILGLDMSTKKTGFSILDMNRNLIEYGLIRTETDNSKSRIEELYWNIEKVIIRYIDNIDTIVFEDVPVSSHNNLKTGKDLCILQGVILSLCFKYNIKFCFYNPSAWRSIIGLYDGTREGMKRDAQKQKAVNMVNQLYDLNFVYNATETKTRRTDDDIAEAICIALSYITEIEKG